MPKYNTLRMDSRERFLAALQYGSPDRLPRLEEGIRQEVLLAWQAQGLEPGVDLARRFGFDPREEVELDLEPRPAPRRYPRNWQELEDFRRRCRFTLRRLPPGWRSHLGEWRARRHPLILRVQRGFFLSLGVEDWGSFVETIALTKDEPALAAELLRLQGELSAWLVEQFLSRVSVEAALFSEPIGGNHGPLISPAMYAELALPAYQPILEALRRFQVPLIIMRTYANPRPLLPLWLQAGVNCLWAVEPPPQEMDYLDLRREFGKALRLIGGIDADALREGRAAIRRQVERLAPLAAEGGYIPLLDGRVRDEVSYADYCYYRAVFAEVFAAR